MITINVQPGDHVEITNHSDGFTVKVLRGNNKPADNEPMEQKIYSLLLDTLCQPYQAPADKSFDTRPKVEDCLKFYGNHFGNQ